MEAILQMNPIRIRWLVLLFVGASAWLELVEHQPFERGVSTHLIAELLLLGVGVPALALRGRKRFVQMQRQAATRLVSELPARAADSPVTVLVIHEGSVLGSGIVSLLRNERNVNVWGVSAREPSEVSSALQNLQPDVAIVDAATNFGGLNQVLTMMELLPQLKVIVMCAGCDEITVFDKSRVRVESTGDLVAVLRERSDQPPAPLQQV